MTLRWGIAATGRIARDVGAVLRDTPGMSVVAVGSRDAGRATALAHELGGERGYGSYAELASDPEVDAVYVATPHTMHAEVAEAALAAGKAVLCEKPLTPTLAETERLLAAAERSGAFLLEAVWMRFAPLVRALGELVAGGGLGEIRTLQASFGFAAPDDPSSRLWDPALGGGALLDLGCYTLGLARLLLGEPESVRTTGSRTPSGADRESTVTLGFDRGATAVLTQSLVTALPGEALVVGTRGWARLGPPFHAPTRLVVSRDGAEPTEQTTDDRNAGYVEQALEVARCVEAGRMQSEVVSWEESRQMAALLDRCLSQIG